MPRSKRQKIVHLTKTDKKGRELKEKLVSEIHDAIDNYEHIYVFAVDNMRNSFLKEVREEFKETGRFFLGKNKVMAKALGTTEEDEYRKDLHRVAESLVGTVGLFLTNSSPEEILPYFSSFIKADYARSGQIATETITIPEGQVFRGVDPMPNNMEAQLRKLGMPTRLKTGVVVLDKEYTICREGDVLTPEQGQLLKIFYHQLSTFQIRIKAHWNNGTFEELEAPSTDSTNEADELMSDEDMDKEE